MTSGDAGAAHGKMPSQRPPTINWSLAGFLLLFVASRLLYVVLIDPGHMVYYGAQELYRGPIAQDLVTGLKMPFTESLADNYSGGSLVIKALCDGTPVQFLGSVVNHVAWIDQHHVQETTRDKQQQESCERPVYRGRALGRHLAVRSSGIA